MSSNRGPSFIGVGMPRSGTTWISLCIGDHPEVSMSDRKEIHFFDIDEKFNKGKEYYESLFPNDGKKHFEFTTEYWEERFLKRIKSFYPEIKLIVVLRNPVDRSFSHYLYRKRKSGRPKTFEELFENDPYGIIDTSLYFKHLSKIYEYFDKDQVIVLIYDDFKDGRFEFVQSVYKKLGLNPDFEPKYLNKQTNRSRDLVYHFNLFERLFKWRIRIQRSKLGFLFVKLLKITGIAWVLVKLRGLNMKKGDGKEKEYLSDNTIMKLKEIFLPDIEKLEKLIEKDLSLWK